MSEAGRASIGDSEVRASAAVPFLLSFFMEQVKRGKNLYWEPYLADSMVYWVQDGVVVDEQVLVSLKTSAAVACYLNAEALPTDMTTFHLAESSQRNSRVLMARRVVGDQLWDLNPLAEVLEKMIQKGKVAGYAAGGFMALAGVGLLWASPFHGAGLMVAGAFVAGTAANSRLTRFNVIMSSIDELREELRRKS